ncbi:MAG: substrate-binding domain-containing protein [Alphaproteobacteria bacterium]|nr:substrate-binding domain-containing protein [Alphaproteobacteria bacterium]
MRQVAASLIIVTVAGCGQPAEPPAPSASLTLGGPEALAKRLLPDLAGSYGRQKSTTPPRVRTIRSESGGIRELLDAEIDAAFSSRDATPSEEDQAKVLGFTFDSPDSRHIVAVDVVAVGVHPRNPLDSLTYDQVIGIFCTHTIENWSALGHDDHPIRALVREPGSGTRDLFEDFFCGPQGLSPKLEVVSATQIGSALTDDPYAVAMMSLSEGVGKPLSLRVQPNASPVKPSQDNIVRGQYPLFGDVYVYTRGKPTGELSSFLDWIASPAGQEVIDELRYVPLSLRPDRADTDRPLRETLQFEVDSSVPNQRSNARMQVLISELKEKQYRHVILEGFTDDREADPYKLSQQRAEAVRTLLSDAMPELYVEIIPRGPKSPIAPNDTPYGRQVNRRVQVYLAEEETRREDAAVPEGG